MSAPSMCTFGELDKVHNHQQQLLIELTWLTTFSPGVFKTVGTSVRDGGRGGNFCN